MLLSKYRGVKELFRLLGLLILILVTALLILPSLIVYWFPSDGGQVRQTSPPLSNHTFEELQETVPLIYISVYRSKTKEIQRLPLEKYIQGVVASEMPAEFEMEALKAQSLAARTYIIRRMVERDYSDAPEGAMVTDTEKHQVYQDEQELRERWGADYEQKISRINQAVNATIGQVLTYEGKPIDATFFSTSNGFTENSEDYWSKEIPYLRSVESPWDKESPRYQNETRMSLRAFQEKLGVSLSLPVQTGSTIGEIISRTPGNRVKEVQIGDKRFTGKEIREILGLDSADFTWRLDGDQLVIHTYGWGHGVGMSQWGANGMAQQGYQAEEIVKHYYRDIHVQDYRQWIARK